jgi:hypothetical protein
MVRWDEEMKKQESDEMMIEMKAALSLRKVMRE